METILDEAESPSIVERRRSPRPGFWSRNETWILGTISVSAFLLFWQYSVSAGLVNPLFTSSPIRIVRTAIDMFSQGEIYNDIKVSGIEFLWGYALSILVGVPMGILMGWYRRINAIFEPFVSALYASPRIALVPLMVIWFGIGLGSKIAIIFLGAVFPILINMVTGVRTVDRDFIKVARAFGASDRQLFATVVFPSTVPMLLAGLRLGLGHALIGIVVGEMYAATAGIGYMISVAGSTFRTSQVMVGVIMIAGLGVGLTEALRAIERRFERWRPDNRR
ncbi:MAG TPA: ABC transporter permease [Acidocella sp.]|nr:ABC transporter permease [Acidocella sp.]